jgi:acyl-CoA synthetase (AMP-forming)/AMP-acid ligase II
MNNLDRLRAAFRTALGLPEDVDVDRLEYRGIEHWDSLAHLTLIAEIEDAFDVTRPATRRCARSPRPAAGGRLFVMYGQTEAAPRLTTLPAGRLGEKVGSVGPAVPGGRLSIRLEDGTETTAPDVRGEVLYRGPNVMLGYAETAADPFSRAKADAQRVGRPGELGDGDGY